MTLTFTKLESRSNLSLKPACRSSRSLKTIFRLVRDHFVDFVAKCTCTYIIKTSV